jgi:hypothetical protein
MVARGRVGMTKLGLLLCLGAVVALVLTGCSSSNKSASVNNATTTTPTTGAPKTAVVTANGVQVIPGSATGTSPCEKAAPTPSSPGQVAGGGGGTSGQATKAAAEAGEHGARGMTVQKSLTHAEREALEAQMTVARQVANEFPTVKEALAAGYMRSTPFVPCIGAHYTNTAKVFGFHPDAPSELLYDGTDPDSKIVGLSYLVLEPGGKPPAGFAGNNDHWHQHNANGGLCLKGGVVVGGEDTTRADCAARGGHKTLLTDIWMLHAWIVPGFECSWGTFSGECPELGGVLCGNAWEAPDPNNFSQCTPKKVNGE